MNRLVAGLRRGVDLRPIDAFRLRQIVEFAFANIVIALLAFPLASLAGTDVALRVLGLAAVAYVVATFAQLAVRSIRTDVRWTPGWRLAAISLGAVIVLLGLVLAVAPTTALFELVLVGLLMRPMLAFLLVLSSLEGDAPRT